jgi:hypothetical protein
MIDTPPGADTPVSIGRFSRESVEMADKIGQDFEDEALYRVNEKIQEQQCQYLMDAAGVTLTYDTFDTTHRAVNELQSYDYGRLSDSGVTSTIWIFHPKTADQVRSAAAEVMQLQPRRLHGYPIELSTVMPTDRFVLVDVEALTTNRTEHGPNFPQRADENFTISVPRPWLVRDPHGVVTIDYPAP